ncbi:hypothetical protein GCM10022198_04150 [Klugiella xanthotipulae]
MCSREYVVLHIDTGADQLGGEEVAGGAHVIVLCIDDKGAGEAVNVVTAGEPKSVIEPES